LLEAKLETLRADIREGIDSGPSEPWDVEEILSEAKRQKADASHGTQPDLSAMGSCQS
jgi:Arc/MetJ-type ribon-helix-helix transcriptional regulator